MWYPRSTPPDGWLVCNGQSTLIYPELAAIVGSYVPDLRGEFIRGWDSGKGIDPGRTFGSWQMDSIIYHEHFLFNSDVPLATPSIGVNSSNFSTGGAWKGDDAYWIQGSNKIPTFGRSSGVGSTETRPRNVALLPCIKY
ncbi:phage tail protein [Anaerospora hongkongensis]|uniref:phage tail protein n=1 Tax=Anaerospora hongkongensis TaxID=244830 RepID=UPI002FDA34EB